MANGIVSFFLEPRVFAQAILSGGTDRNSREASLKVCRQILYGLNLLFDWKTIRNAFVYYIPGGICPEPQDRLALRRCGNIGLEAFPLATFPLDLEVGAGCRGPAIKASLLDIDKQPYPGDALLVAIDSLFDAFGTVPTGYWLHGR